MVTAPARPRPERSRPLTGPVWWSVPVTVVAFGVVGVLVMVQPEYAGPILAAGAVGSVAAFAGLMVPAVAAVLLLSTQFFRLPLSGVLPADPFLLAFVGMVAAALIAHWRGRSAPARFGPLAVAMGCYLLWNIGSSLAEHEFDAVETLTAQPISVWRFILTGTVIPFAMFAIGRYVLVRPAAVRAVLWLLLALTAYSAATAVFMLYGPSALVWPRYLLTANDWPGRAVGIFNQPVVNGLVMIVGFLAGIVVATAPGRCAPRVVAALVAAAATVGVYLTHTRVVWLAFVIVLLAGLVTARGFRWPFAAVLGTAVVFVAVNWTEFISSDRSAGGVTSSDEIEDRLNIIATSFWAIEHKPWFGWGIGRFASVNTYHHQQWSPDVPWMRGYGIVSHFNELGIAAELGLVGLALWIVVLALVARRVWTAFRRVQEPGLFGRHLVFLGAMSFVVLVITGFTVDLRLFDFPNTLVMVLVGVTVGISDRLERLPQAPRPRPAPRRPPPVEAVGPALQPRVEVRA